MSESKMVTFKKPSGTVIGQVKIGENDTVSKVSEEIPPRLGQSLHDASGNRRTFSVYSNGNKLQGDLPLIRHLQDDDSVVLTSDSVGA